MDVFTPSPFVRLKISAATLLRRGTQIPERRMLWLSLIATLFTYDGPNVDVTSVDSGVSRRNLRFADVHSLAGDRGVDNQLISLRAMGFHWEERSRSEK